MLSRILWTLLLAAPVAASAQYMTTGPNGQLVPAGSTVVVVGSGTGPVLTTPTASFATPQTTAGISLADRAGVNPSAPPGTSLPGAPEASAGYSNAGYGYQAGSQTTGESTAVSAANAANTGRLVEDMGPSSFAGAGYVEGRAMSGGSQVAGSTKSSLGEIAAIYKANRPQNIRTYTNADAERLNAKNGVGAGTTTASAANMPATQMQPPPTTSVPPTQPQLSANLRPSPSIRANAAQSDAGSSAQGNTRPPAQPQSGHAQQSDQESGRTLPASSTLLPLFGLLGLASGGLGIWLTKYRK